MMAMISAHADHSVSLSIGHIFTAIDIFRDNQHGNIALSKAFMTFAFVLRKDIQNIKLQLFRVPSFSKLN